MLSSQTSSLLLFKFALFATQIDKMNSKRHGKNVSDHTQMHPKSVLTMNTHVELVVLLCTMHPKVYTTSCNRTCRLPLTERMLFQGALVNATLKSKSHKRTFGVVRTSTPITNATDLVLFVALALLVTFQWEWTAQPNRIRKELLINHRMI